MTENDKKRWALADVNSLTFDNGILDNLYYTSASRGGAKAIRSEELSDGRVISNSDIYSMQKQSSSPYDSHLSKEGMQSVSQTRQDYLRELNDRFNGSQIRPQLSLAEYVPSKERLRKNASSGAPANLGSATSTTHLAPEMYSPLFLTQNLQLPRDRITANAWNRAFFETNPIVRNAINLHATYPISKMNIKCEDKAVETFFNDMADRVDLLTVVQNCASEYFKMGESVSAKTLITCSDGSIKPITEVKVGDEIITHLGNRKKVTYTFIKPVSNIINNGNKIYRIKILGQDESLIVSGNHPILSINQSLLVCNTTNCVKRGIRLLPGKSKCSNCGKAGSLNDHLPDFTEMKNLQEKDVVYAPYYNKVQDSKFITAEISYLMGQRLAEESYCRCKNTLGVKLTGIKHEICDKNYILKGLDLCQKELLCHDSASCVNENCKLVKDKGDIHCSSKAISEHRLTKLFTEHCGSSNEAKTLSKELMSLPLNKQVCLLAGFIDVGGRINENNGQAILSTSSRSLANQFMLILRRLGARPMTYKSMVNGARKSIGNYNVLIVANDAFKLFKGKLLTGKEDFLRETKRCSLKTAIQDNWQVTNITKIEDITESFKDEFMYDIEVEDDHSYVANGIAIHNCLNYASFDEATGVWDKIYQLNPDFVSVKASPIPGTVSISLKPDPELQRIVMSSDPEHIKIREQLDEKIVHHVLMNEYIPLDNFNVSHIKNLASPYDVRGTSMLVAVWKDLMLYDKLREAKFVQADGMINPLTLVKLGSSNPDGFYPRQQELETWRSILEQAQFDRDFKIVTHDAVSIERVGFNGSVLDVAQDFQMIIDNILMGLMVPKAVLNQEGATYASASVGLDVMRQRYNSFRTMMANWLEKKIFAPISEVQGFYKYESGKKRLIVPEIEWNQMTLYDVDTYIAHISNLVNQQSASKSTLYRSLGLSRGNELTNMRAEAIEDAILQKEKEVLANFSLAELRSLDPEKPVVEPEIASLPGQAPGGPSLPGAPGGPGGDLGGLPPLSPPGGGGLPPLPGPPLGGSLPGDGGFPSV